ncbi:MAG TPA: hypothetical protein VJ022_15980, partial [Anaerolineales bacterium]|nr:hypothetical protein [Anaerolineales bacterium]
PKETKNTGGIVLRLFYMGWTRHPIWKSRLNLVFLFGQFQKELVFHIYRKPCIKIIYEFEFRQE